MSRLHMRRYFAEFIGTFVIVFAPVALSATGKLPGADSGLMAAAWVSGLAVTAMIYAFGPISAAHFNPAVTMALALAKRFPKNQIAPYITCQALGGIAAAATVAALFGSGYGAHRPAGSPLQAVVVEAILTFILMIVIMAAATDKRTNSAVPGLAIGLTVVLDVFIGGAVSGGSMNPARSLGPALVAGGSALANYWVYLVGPVMGALFAALAYELLRDGNEFATSAPGSW